MSRVIIESPFAADTAAGVRLNERYARAAMLDSLRRGEAPFASHLLYTQVLDDRDERERRLGMRAGWEWMHAAEMVVVYNDRGVSPGMARGVERALRCGVPTETRQVPSELLSALGFPG